MFIRLIGFGVALALTLTGVACATGSSSEPTTTPRPTSTPSRDLPFAAAELPNVVLHELKELGVEVEEPDERESTWFGLPGTLIIVNETEWIQFSEFPTARFAIIQAASQDFNLGSYEYRYGNVLIRYFGDDTRVTGIFESYSAEQIASGERLLANGAESIKTEFSERGFEIIEQDPFDLGITLPSGHRSKYFYVDGDEVHIWEYEQYSSLSDAPRAISRDGKTIKSDPDARVTFDWSGTPWFFEQGNTIALYIGDNRDIIDALRDIAGREFAGGDLTEAYPWTVDALQERLRSTGLTVERQEPENSGSFLTRPSETWLLNRNPAEVFVFRGPTLNRYNPSLSGERPHSTPHLFQKENVAIYYVGDDVTVINALESLFGWSSMSGGELPIERMGVAKGDIETAVIREVEVYSRRPHNDGYIASINSENGGCVRYHGHTVDRDGDRFIITVTNRDHSTGWESLPDTTHRACTSDLRSHTTYVPLDELMPGVRYSLEVNGEERASFTAR